MLHNHIWKTRHESSLCNSKEVTKTFRPFALWVPGSLFGSKDTFSEEGIKLVPLPRYLNRFEVACTKIRLNIQRVAHFCICHLFTWHPLADIAALWYRLTLFFVIVWKFHATIAYQLTIKVTYTSTISSIMTQSNQGVPHKIDGEAFARSAGQSVPTIKPVMVLVWR